MITTLKRIWTERKQVIIYNIIPLLYSIGGGGWKPSRRFLLPLVLVASFPNTKLNNRLFAFIAFAVAFSMGYGDIVWHTAHNWPAMFLHGAIMGGGFVILNKRRGWLALPVMAAAFPLSVYLCHSWGLNWQWAEFVVGLGLVISFRLTKEKSK